MAEKRKYARVAVPALSISREDGRGVTPITGNIYPVVFEGNGYYTLLIDGRKLIFESAYVKILHPAQVAELQETEAFV